MKKIILFFCCAFFLFSCGKQPETREIIKFWHFWSEPNQKQALTDLIAKFEELHNCKVELTELSWNDGKTKLIAAFNSKTGPDVLELGSDWVAQFSSTSVLAELHPDSVQIEKYIDFSTAPCYWNNKIYALPWVVDTRVLYFNKDLLMQSGRDINPPSTYSDLLDLCRAVHLGNNIYGFGANGSDPNRLYKKILPLFWSFGGEIFDKNNKLVLNSKSNIAALNMYLQLSKAGMIETQRQLDAAFIQGRIAFWTSGAWLIDKITNENPKLNYGVAMMPGLTSYPGYSFAGGEYIAVNGNTNNYKLAIELAKFLTDGANALDFCKRVNEAGFPADKSFYNDSSLIRNDFKKVFAEQLKYTKMTPVHSKWLEIQDIIENATVQVLYDKLTPESALQQASEEIQFLLDN